MLSPCPTPPPPPPPVIDFSFHTFSCSPVLRGAIAFNGDLSPWDISSVTSFYSSFSAMPVWNNDLSSWDTSAVVDFDYMIYYTDEFNGDLSSWDTSAATTMERRKLQAH